MDQPSIEASEPAKWRRLSRRQWAGRLLATLMVLVGVLGMWARSAPFASGSQNYRDSLTRR